MHNDDAHWEPKQLLFIVAQSSFFLILRFYSTGVVITISLYLCGSCLKCLWVHRVTLIITGALNLNFIAKVWFQLEINKVVVLHKISFFSVISCSTLQVNLLAIIFFLQDDIFESSFPLSNRHVMWRLTLSPPKTCKAGHIIVLSSPSHPLSLKFVSLYFLVVGSPPFHLIFCFVSLFLCSLFSGLLLLFPGHVLPLKLTR